MADSQVTVEQIFNMGPANDSDHAAPAETVGAGSSQSAPATATTASTRSKGPGTGQRRPSGAARAYRPGGAGMGTSGAGIGVLNVVFAPFRLVLGVLSGVWYLFSAYFSRCCAGNAKRSSAAPRTPQSADE